MLRMRGRKLGLAAGAVAALLVLLVTACGSSGKPAGASTSTSGSSSSSSQAVGGNTSFTGIPKSALNEQYVLSNQSPSALLSTGESSKSTWTGPTSAPSPKKNVTVGVVACDLSLLGCQYPADGVQAAARVLGWKTIVLDGKSNTQTQQSAITQLINRHVNAILIASISSASISAQIKAAHAAGIPVISDWSSNNKPFGGSGVVGINDYVAGEWDAAYVLTHGGGNIVEFTSKENPQIWSRSVGFNAYLQKYGKGRVHVLDEESIPFSEIGPTETTMMSSLLSKYSGKINWVFAGFDAMLRPLITAIDSAGLSKKIRGVASDGDLPSLNDIRTGNVEVADVGYPLHWAGWAMVDEANRLLQGGKFVDPGMQMRLLVKSNLPKAGQPYDGDLNYEAQYRKLWGVSGG